MAITRIQNNQITDSSEGNVYLGVNAASKVQNYSITGGKLQNNLTYGSDFTITGNLTVQGNTTTIDTVNLTVEDPLILLAKEQTGAPTLDIGYIGKRGTEDNIAFVWDESQDEFVTVFTTSENTNTTITINSYASLRSYNIAANGNVTVAGTSDFNGLVTLGNITFDAGSNIQVGDNRIQNVAAPSVGTDAANKDYVDGVASSGFTIEADSGNTQVSGGDTLELFGTANQVSVIVTGNDQVTFALTSNVSVAGNVTGGNILTGGIVSATGNITAGGNIAAGNISVTGNVAANGILTDNLYYANGSPWDLELPAGSNTQIQFNDNNDFGASANLTFDFGTNQFAVIGTASVTGTATVGNLATAGTVSATGNVTGGNLITGGIASVTGTATVGNLATAGTMSATGNATAGNVFTGGVVSATGNVTGGNLVTAGVATVTGNVIGGNITTAGEVSATGNATAANMLTGGIVSATGNVTGGNLVTAGVATVTGNVIGGNITTAGQVTATGNVTGGNVNATADVSATGNIFGNNITSYGFVSAAGNVIAPIVVTGTVTTASGDLVLNSAGGALQWDGTGNIVMNGQWINNLADPVAAFDAATKQYVDDAVSTGITVHTPVYLETPSALPAATYAQGGTTATVTDTVAGNTVVFSAAISPQVNDQYWFTNSFSGIVANTAYFVVSAPNTSAAVLSTTYDGAPVSNISNATGLTQAVRVNSGIGATLTGNTNAALSVDGVAVTVNDRILVYNQTPAYENGVYVVTQTGNVSAPYILTRSTDTDVYGPKSTQELDVGDYFYVQAGNTGAGESYVMTAPTGPFIIGFNNITFTQFSASQVYTANTAAGLVLNGTVFSAKVDNDTTAFDGGGNIIVKAGANLVTPNIGAATGTSLSVTGNVVSANVNTGIVSASGNVTGANILTGGIVSATGNITGNYFIGNGSQLTGVTASSVDANNLTGNTLAANVVNSSLTSVGNLVTLSVVGTTTTGNLDTAGTVSATGTVTGGNLVTGGTLSATGTATVGNLDTAGTVSATGTVTGGNLVTGGTLSVTGTATLGNVATGGTVSAGGNVTGDNLLTGGVVSATGNVTAGNVSTGIISATGNINGTGAVFSGNVSAANFIGNISGNIDAAGANTQVQFNNGDLLDASANFTFNTATNIMSVTGTIQGTTVSATGNVIGGNVTTAGLVSAGGNVTGANFDTAGLVTATGNVTGGNIITGGYVTATGNVTAANLVLASGTIDGPAAGIIAVNGTGLDTDFSVSGDTVANILYIDAGVGTASFGNSGAITNAIASFNTTDSILLPRGNTAQRPAPATVGMFRFNTTSDALEVYNSGSGWTTVEQDFTVIVADSFTGNGVQTIFTLSEDSTTAGTIVSINGVVQIPTTAYSVSGNALTFTEAPSVSDTIDARILTTSTTVASLSNASGNATVECLDAADTVQIEGNLLPSANVTYNLGSPTKMWKDAYFAGNTIYLGNLQLKQADATTFAVYTNDGITQANIDVGSVDVSSIISGTTVIGIGAPNGNAYLAPAGSNALVAASTGVFVTGVMSATGNVVAGNVTTAGLISATGNITGGNLSGTNIVGTLTTAAQTNITSVGTLTSLNSGAISSSGNVTAANILTGGLISATGNITGNFILGNGSQLTGIDATSIQSGTSNVRVVSSGGNVTAGIGGTGNVLVLATTGAFVTGLASVTGNITAGNLSVDTGTVNVGNIVNTNANGVGNIGSSSLYFNTVFAKATSAQYADLAEMYEADGPIEPGTVVAFGGAKEVTTCGEDGSRRVAGVVSTNPSYIMNAGLAGDTVVAVALTGRVPTRVTGTVRKGDLMVAAGGGRARAEANPAVGAVIGKALADFDGAEGTIEVVVGRL